MSINWRKGEPKSDRNPVPVKLVDAITGEPVDLTELFGSISVDVGDIDLGSITIKDGASGNLAAVDASGRVSVDGSSVTQPVSAASLPLPLGAATAASQTTIISALGDIVTNTTGLATEAGQVAELSALEDIVTATEAIQAAVEDTLDVDATITGSAGSSGSVALTTGGAAEDLFSGATPTNGYLVINPSADEIMWINEGADAAPNGTGSIPIFPLGGYETPPLYKPFGRVSVVAATTGHKITARKW